MGKMLPVPSINGLDELLSIVNNESKIAEYLRKMRELRASIKENLEVYSKHDTADQRLREADVMHEAILKIQKDNREEKLRMDKSFQRRRKAVKKQEADMNASEKLLKEQWDVLHKMQQAYAKEALELKEKSEIFENESRMTKLHIEEEKAKLTKRKDLLALKFQKLSELFD